MESAGSFLPARDRRSALAWPARARHLIPLGSYERAGDERLLAEQPVDAEAHLAYARLPRAGAGRRGRGPPLPDDETVDEAAGNLED